MCKVRVYLLHILIVTILFVGAFSLYGQSRWKAYYSYKASFDIVETPEFIVGATSLGLIYYHKDTRATSVKNKVNGLSDVGISAIEYVPEKELLYVGYSNGNIDVIDDGKVINIPDLKIESMNGSKKINHFYYYDGGVYCSTDFGIMKLDAQKNEVASTFIIGDDASNLIVYATLVDNGFIYAATSEGVLYSSVEGNALAFYENWELFSESASQYCDLGISQEGVIGVRGSRGKTCVLELITEEGTIVANSYNRFRSLTAYEDAALVSTSDRIFIHDASLSVTETIESVSVENSDEEYSPSYRSALLSDSRGLWFADWNGGLFYEKTDGGFSQILPPGPYNNSVFKTLKAGDDLWIVPGGFGQLYNNGNIAPRISILTQDGWVYFDKDNTPEFKKARDLINIEANPQDPGNVFVSSWGTGVFEFDKNSEGNITLSNHFVDENSGLQNVSTLPTDRYTRVWGLSLTDEGIFYMTNSSVKVGVVVYNMLDGTWHQYDYGATADAPNMIGEILIDNNKTKWINVPQGPLKGLFVFDDKGTVSNQGDDRYRSSMSQAQDGDNRNAGELLLWDENGEVITDNVYDFAKDNNGYIWLGTDVGVVVQYNPASVFDVQKPVFTRIKIPRDDGSGLADYLLENQTVTAIAIDGANRKYFGTDGSGIYIISEDGTRTVDHFNKSNSPLPSNSIINIDIDDASGEVFISTNAGLISYMGDAVQGGSVFGDVYAYPNPVRPGYEGPITITGLVERTNVKITDTAGNLVFETTSLGGNALWNGENLWGQKVKPGVYVVFLSSPDGSLTEYTKIAIVR